MSLDLRVRNSNSVDGINFQMTSVSQVDEVKISVANRDARNSSIQADEVALSLANRQVEEHGHEHSLDHPPANERLPADFEEIRNSFRLNYTGANGFQYKRELNSKERDNLARLYIRLRDKIAPEAKDLKIHHQKQIITYTDAEGVRVTVDLLDDSTDQVKNARNEIDAYLNQIDEMTHFRRALYDLSPNKGSLHGTKSLNCPAVISKPYPHFQDQIKTALIPAMILTKGADCETKRLMMMDSVGFASFCRKHLLIKFNEFKTEIENEYNQVKDKTERIARKKAADLQKDLFQISAMIKDLEDLDMIALSAALCNYPLAEETGGNSVPIQRIEQIAKILEENLTAEFNLLDPQMKNRGQIEGYVQDIVGLLYLNRWDYMDFCKERGLELKKESIEDAFIRETFAFAKSKETSRGIVNFLMDRYPLSIETKERLSEKIDPAMTQIRKSFEGFLKNRQDERNLLFKANSDITPDESVRVVYDRAGSQLLTDAHKYMTMLDQVI